MASFVVARPGLLTTIAKGIPHLFRNLLRIQRNSLVGASPPQKSIFNILRFVYLIAEFTRVGNDNADHYAGWGAACAEHQLPSAPEKARYAKARRWYQWLMMISASWPAD